MDLTVVGQSSIPANVRPIIARLSWRGFSLSQIAPLALGLGTIVMTLYGLFEGSSSTVAAYMVFGSVGLAIAWCGGRTSVRLYLTVYGLAAVAAVALAAVFTAAYEVPYWGGGSDELHYEEMGIEFAQEFPIFDYGAIRGGLVHEGHNSVGYIYLVGLLAKFSNWFDCFHTMVPRLFNASCLALLSVVIYHTGTRLGLQERMAVAAALFAGLLPLMMWVSVQTLRDVFLALLLVTLVFVWVPDGSYRWRYSVPVLLALSALLLVPVWEMRKPQALVGFLFIAFAILSNRRSFEPLHFLLVTVPIAATAVYVISQSYDSLNKDVLDYVDGIEFYAELRGTGGTGGGLSLVVFNTPLFPLGWLYRTAYALATPLPVEYDVLDKAWLSLGTIIHLLYLPFLLMGLKRAIGHPAWRLISVAFVLLFIGMAMFTFTGRHITQYLPFAILLGAMGYEQYQGNRRRVLLTMGIVGAVLGVTYTALKVL